MKFRDTLLAALVDRFDNQPMHAGTSSDAVEAVAYSDLIARFPAKHPEIGDACVWGTGTYETGLNDSVLSAAVSVGDIIIQYCFRNYDVHLDSHARAVRVTSDVVRFLQELFADRLLFWKPTDGGNAEWRECRDAGQSEPLVLDDRAYRTYLWSGPLSIWRATPTILARGRIRDDRDYHILLRRLNGERPEGFEGAERELASRLLADYELGGGAAAAERQGPAS